MKRCTATSKSGKRCLNDAKFGAYCHVHKVNDSLSDGVSVAAGALIGNVIVPGLGGAIIGGIVGKLAKSIFIEGEQMAKKRVFVSFDFDNDRVLKDFVLGQAKHPDSPFDVTDHSLKEAAPERDWEAKARSAISRADIVLVMVGPHTHKAHGVLKEVAMARATGTKIVQVIGYKDGNYTAVPDAGRLYAWNWENLKQLLS